MASPESESRVGLLKEDLAAVRVEMSEYKKDVIRNFQADPNEMWTWDMVAVFKVLRLLCAIWVSRIICTEALGWQTGRQCEGERHGV